MLLATLPHYTLFVYQGGLWNLCRVVRNGLHSMPQKCPITQMHVQADTYTRATFFYLSVSLSPLNVGRAVLSLDATNSHEPFATLRQEPRSGTLSARYIRQGEQTASAKTHQFTRDRTWNIRDLHSSLLSKTHEAEYNLRTEQKQSKPCEKDRDRDFCLFVTWPFSSYSITVKR